MIPEGARKEVQLVCHYKIVSNVEKYNISYSMIVNLDQAPSNLVQSSGHTMENGIAYVEIVGSDDKRSITAIFVVKLDGRFLPM